MKWGIIEISKELVEQWRLENNTVFEKLYPMGFKNVIELDSTERFVVFAFQHKDCNYSGYYDVVCETHDDGSIGNY